MAILNVRWMADLTHLELTIEGNRIRDIPSFYAEINRVFMSDEEWQLGPSLDALDDMLYGGYGALNGVDTVTLIWKGFKQTREALGIAATRAYYLNKLDQPSVFNVAKIRRDLEELDQGTGPTYFKIVLQIFDEHPHIRIQEG